ncbi:MAG: hypothetical protein GEV12_14250 [Micromonosporaceae bacterium]|nr:hypothetical protein [Micromonosporaceae bacterium]
MTLVEFLRARLDEDEQVATEALRGYPSDDPASAAPWRAEYHRVMQWPRGRPHSEVQLVVQAQWGDVHATRHIARHDPARVLAEVDARRRIIDGPNGGGGPESHDEWVETLRLLALPYADHDDYDPAWRPE